MKIATTIAPWLTVSNGRDAIAFYKNAFDAIETYYLEVPDGGIIARLSINGAEFWISGGATEISKESIGGETIRMILTIHNPDEIFVKALNAGAIEVYPIGEDHGWRLGRLEDPFGLHWEIGYPLADQ